MATRWKTDDVDVDEHGDELECLLANAHWVMDQRGYRPATRTQGDSLENTGD